MGPGARRAPRFATDSWGSTPSHGRGEQPMAGGLAHPHPRRVRSGAISLNNGRVYPEETFPFFVPMNSVAVFDHTVSGPILNSVDCFVVSGHALSPKTFRAIRGRVAKGAVCIISRPLYEKHRQKPLPGRWGDRGLLQGPGNPLRPGALSRPLGRGAFSLPGPRDRVPPRPHPGLPGSHRS